MKQGSNFLHVNILHKPVETSWGIFISNDFHQLKYAVLLQQTDKLYDEQTNSHNRYNLLVQRDKQTSNCLLFHLDLHWTSINLIHSDSYIPPFQQIELSAHQLLGRYLIWTEDLRKSLPKWEYLFKVEYSLLFSACHSLCSKQTVWRYYSHLHAKCKYISMLLRKVLL